MTVIFPIQNGFARLALVAALVVATGCDAEQSVGKIEPGAAPSARPGVSSSTHPLQDLKKDLKPPVVVKPGALPTTETVPTAPKREAR